MHFDPLLLITRCAMQNQSKWPYTLLFLILLNMYIVAFVKLLLFLTPVLWFPFFLFVCFVFVTFPRQWRQGDRIL